MSYTDILEQNLSESAVKNVAAWLSEAKYSEYRDELKRMIELEQWQELEDSFFKVIEFGTAGRRGTTGIGSNRINRVTIGESAQALCIYARTVDPGATAKGIVIAYDTRLSSPELSKVAAQVCAANGFTTYLFDSFRSTPELSFAVRELEASAGIVVSASHNPPADNGFKAYWSDGGQLAPSHNEGMLEAAASSNEIHTIDYDEAVETGKIKLIGKEIDERYIAAVLRQARGIERNVDIVYSPLHGAGQTNVLPVLQTAGFTNVSPVALQMAPDGNFPTVKDNKPNPEEKAANDMAVAQLKQEEADIAITNDPDADRIGVMVRQGSVIKYLSGNQTAVLATDYVLAKLQEKDMLSSRHYIVKTIVTTDMLAALAKHYNITLYGELLIGFKYIAELMLQKEATDETFVSASEESFGLLIGDYARDKDGAAGALPIAEYAAELKKQGKTLYDRLLELYQQHGLYVEQLASTYFPGASGFEKMQLVMQQLRTSPPSTLDGHVVSAILDYQTLERRDIATGNVTPIECAPGNMVILELDNDSRRRVTVRPSGTEPKLKFYVQWFEEAASGSDIQTQYEVVDEQLKQLSKTLEDTLLR